MTNELYDRQNRLDLNIPDSAIIVGLGGTGALVALLLAASGCPELTLMDGDKLELSNFARLPLPVGDYIGKNKAEAVADYIAKVRPDCYIHIEGRANGFTLSTVTGQFLFDCTDNQKTQLTLSEWAGKKGIQYIRCGYDGTHMTVTSRVPKWNTKEEARTGYEIYPSWIVPAIISAAFAVGKAMFNEDIEIHHDLIDFRREKNGQR